MMPNKKTDPSRAPNRRCNLYLVERQAEALARVAKGHVFIKTPSAVLKIILDEWLQKNKGKYNQALEKAAKTQIDYDLGDD
jgi:hypothetical protein